MTEVADERKEIKAYLDSAYMNGSQLIRRSVPFTLKNTGLESTYFDALYHPLFDDQNRVIGVFAEGHDVTARVREENAQPVALAETPRLPELTDRQCAVLAGIMAGLSNKQIAHRLGISDRTAEMHRQSMLRRLGMRTTGQLVSALASRPELAALAKIDAVIAPGGLGSVEANADVSRRLAAEIPQVHRALRDEMLALASLVGAQPPDRAAFVEVRYSLTQASLRRRESLRSAIEFLRTSLSSEEQAIVHRLRLSDDALLNRSVAHTSKWKTDVALRDWNSYVEASASLRQSMAAQMDLERSLLLPLLLKHASGR